MLVLAVWVSGEKQLRILPITMVVTVMMMIMVYIQRTKQFYLAHKPIPRTNVRGEAQLKIRPHMIY